MKEVVVLVVCWCSLIGFSAEVNEVANKQNDNGARKIPANYSYDPQIGGFSARNLTSGPIVLADKRTIFIPDMRYNGTEPQLDFWVGSGSPYGTDKQLVQSEFFSSPVNLYVILPPSPTLDTIDFLQVTAGNVTLDYVIFERVDRNAIRSYDESNRLQRVFRIPKCCSIGYYLDYDSGNCAKTELEYGLNLKIFPSNETGLDPEVTLNATDYEVRPYHLWPQCRRSSTGHLLYVEELHGLIYNSSLIIQGYEILPQGEFCVDTIGIENQTRTGTLYCYYPYVPAAVPNVYVPVLILSAIAFALTAAAYLIILSDQNIHKRCLIIFSSSMCLAFVSLIVMQLQNGQTVCNLFGFVYIFTAVLGFFWLLILCVEILYLVIYPLEKMRYYKRWYWYLAVTFGITTVIFCVSLFSGQLWIADVPNSFIMEYGKTKCQFNTPYSRAFIVFVPIIVSILGSIICSIVLERFVRRNEKNKDIKYHCDWMENYNSYKFQSRTYFIMCIVACFWLINVFLYNQPVESGVTRLALDITEAALGIVTFLACVGNNYTVQELKKRIGKKEQVVEEQVDLNGISTPTTPEADPLMNGPHTFQNNRSRDVR